MRFRIRTRPNSSARASTARAKEEPEGAEAEEVAAEVVTAAARAATLVRTARACCSLASRPLFFSDFARWALSKSLSYT